MIKRTGGKWEGYSIFATFVLTGEEKGSYTEADNLPLAFKRCEDQFPPDAGWDKHWVRNVRTREEFYKDEILPL